jgi:hypothetical protein
MKDLLKPAVRRWLYGIGVAGTAFAGVKGLISSEEVDGLNLILTAVLGMAFLNVNDDEDEGY